MKDINNTKNNEIKNYKESEVAEMKKVENAVVNEIKNNNEGVNEMEKIFDMGKIVDYVVKAIENSKVEGIKEIGYALGFDAEEVMTEQEQEYCKKISSLIEISNSTDYIEKLFTAKELDIFDIDPSYPDNLLYFNNEHIRELRIKKVELEWELKRDYAVYKLPYMKELLDNFMEWYKNEIDYDYLLSSVIDSLECEEMTSLDTVILDYVESELHGTPIQRFTDYSTDCIEGEIWECFAGVIDSDYILNNYWHIVSEIKKEFIDTYR